MLVDCGYRRYPCSHWYLLGNPRLSIKASEFIDTAAAPGHVVALSPISLAEMAYLVEKGRIEASAYDAIKIALADPELVIREAPFTCDLIESMWKVERSEIPTCQTG